jgi:hypothetical protein
VFLVRQNLTFAELQERLHRVYKSDFAMDIYLSHDGDNIRIQDDADLSNAFSLAEGNTVHVILKEG